MQNNFLKKMDVTQDEFSKISLLILQSFFLGFFLYYYFSVISGLFVNTFHIKHLPHAYISSGIFGFLLTNIFIKLQRSIKLSHLQIGLFSSIIIYMFLYLLLFNSYIIDLQFNIFKGFKPFIIYIGFILFFPISTLLTVGMGNMMLKFFDLKQGKRFFPIISSGEVISSALAFGSIPVIISFFSKNNNEKGTVYILLIAIIFLVAAAAIQVYFNVKYKTLINQNIKEKLDTKTSSFKHIIKNKYFLNIILLILVSTIILYVINFTFLKEVGVQYESSNAIIRFFGFFYFVFKLSEFVLKTFFSGKLLTNYGVKAGLFILPLVIFIFTLLSITSLIFKVDSSIIFLMIMLNMLFLLILKRSFEDPAINLLFQSIDASSKLILQSIGIGNTSQISIIISGLIIYLISALTEENLLLYILVSVLILISIWFVLISKVVQSLNDYIKKSLKKLTIKLSSKSDDSVEVLKTYLYNKSKISPLKNETESSFSFYEINSNPLTIEQYYQLYFNTTIEQKKINNSFLEFSKNFQISLQHKALLLGFSIHKDMSHFIIEQLKVTMSFEVRLFIFEYISKHKIELTNEQLQSISSIMNDVFDYYTCLLVSILDLSQQDKNVRLIELLKYELSILEDIIFSYLEILHSEEQIALIKIALKSDKPHENILALELLESIISEQYKRMILTIFDNLSIKSKIDMIVAIFNHYRLELNQRLNSILNSPAYWFNDLIRIETINLIPVGYEIKNSALLSHLYNSNEYIRNKVLQKLKQIDKDKRYKKYYFDANDTEDISSELELVRENISFDFLHENLKFQLYSVGTVVSNFTTKELENLNYEHYALFLLNGSIKLPNKNYKVGEILYTINSIVLDKNMFSSDIVYLRIPHQKLVPFIMGYPSFAKQIVLNQ